MEKPKVEKQTQNSGSPDTHQKKEKKKHEDKKVKHQRPAQFERNPDLITQDTVLEPLPKKSQYLQRPNLKDYQQKEAVNKQKISGLIKKKKQIFEQKFKPTRQLVKGQGGAHQDFQIEIQEFNHLKERFVQLKNQRNEKRDTLAKLFDQAKTNNAELKKLREASKNSREYFQQQLEKLQHKLITQDLSKDQEKNLNTDITLIKRKLKDCEPAGNIEVKISKAEQRKQQLDAEIDQLKVQKQPLEQQCKQLKEQMDSKNQHINKLKGEIKNQNAQKTQVKQKNDKQYEEWKQNKKKRAQDASKKIKDLDDANKKIWEEYHTKNDAYWEQKHKLDFLEWQHRVKDRKIRDKEREKRRETAIQKQKEREKEEQLKKYIKEIQLCNFLANYLKDISQSNKQKVKQDQKVEQPKDINSKLGEDSQWKKQKGLVVLQSKKSKQDEEPVKKGKKNKKKNQKGEETAQKKFQIPFNIEILFQQLKLLAPRSMEQIEPKIKQLKEREALFERACSEEVNESDRTQIEKIKGEGKKQKKDKKEDKKQQEEFPTL